MNVLIIPSHYDRLALGVVFKCENLFAPRAFVPHYVIDNMSELGMDGGIASVLFIGFLLADLPD